MKLILRENCSSHWRFNCDEQLAATQLDPRDRDKLSVLIIHLRAVRNLEFIELATFWTFTNFLNPHGLCALVEGIND